MLSAQQPVQGAALVGFQSEKALEKFWSFYIWKTDK